MNNRFLSGVYKGLFVGAWVSLLLLIGIVYILEDGRKQDNKCKAEYSYPYIAIWSNAQQKLVCVDTSNPKPLPSR